MDFKRVYTGLIFLSVVGFVLVYFRGPIVYILYGFDRNLDGSSSPDAFHAYNATAFVRNLIFYVVSFVTVSCFGMSCISFILSEKVDPILKYVGGIVSFVLLLIYGIAAALPTRIV